MNKKDTISELVNILAKALRHKIGSVVNNNEIYASKYAKDAEVLMNEARRVSMKEKWNNYEKIEIKNRLKKELFKELESKEFIDNKKFEYVDIEIDKAMKYLGL